MNTHRSAPVTRFHGARSWWHTRSARSGAMTTFQREPGGGEKPALRSCNSLISRPTRCSLASSSCGWSAAIGPGTYSSTCRPWSSRPSARGAPVNPARRKCVSSASTAGVQNPAGLRTVSPTRTTPAATFPPPSGCSVIYPPPSPLLWVGPAGGPPAVHRDDGPGDEAGLLGQKVRHRVCDLPGLADPAERVQLGHLEFGPRRGLRVLAREQRLVPLGVDGAERHSVDPDLFGPVVDSRGPQLGTGVPRPRTRSPPGRGWR